MKRKNTLLPTEIEALTHRDTRLNIPTDQNSAFMTEQQKAEIEKAYQRYRRDPALDPQLVWQGKDEDDADDLRVFVRPIYINEKIHPRALVENVRSLAQQGTYIQPELFSDFNGIPFEDMVDFYQHEQHWTNRIILGDSLAVMASLAEKEGLHGKVQMIYIDPPYGIKFNSNWQPSTIKRDVKDGKDVSYEPEQIRAFRDTWEQGVHSYLSYLRDRLRIARELLTESGSIFVQISDENVHRVRSLMDEVFGADNFIAEIIVEKTAGLSMEYLDRVTDYVLWYAKNYESAKYHQLYLDKLQHSRTGASYYRFAEFPDGSRRQLEAEEIAGLVELPLDSRIYSVDALTSQTQATTTRYLAEFQGQFYESGTRQWATPPSGMARLIKAGRVQRRANSIGYVRFVNDFPVLPLRNTWNDTGTGSFTDPKIYVVQTGNKIIERCMLMTTDPGDLVLDPTCGAGTAAYVAEQWGRRWITIDTSRVALALTRTRLISARFPSFHLKEPGNVRAGFVYKTVPHITLKSIANNKQIDAIHLKWQEHLDELRTHINMLANTHWQEWELPKPNPDAKSSPFQKALADWWHIQRNRQIEIDKSISENADRETLFDQPDAKQKAIRVTGPFTVESLSPHRALESELRRNVESANGGRFALDMLDQLREAGVTNTRKGEKIVFTQLDLYPGKHIHAIGVYEQGDQLSRVAVSIGPQYGTVSREMVIEAAKETAKDAINPFDILIVCGFAFDPQVVETTRNMGRLVVQTARINPDLLLMHKDLKKDRSANLFTVFGEPDITVEQATDGKVTVSLRGIDVYDPSSGLVRSDSTDEIACWFIDTDYNEESFFVRHAYFTGDDKPYEKLKSALKAEINPEAWEALYRTESIPFDRPRKGKIAVKVINHFGDEVMKVCEV